MKNVICAGDSYTFHCIDEYLAWPYHLDKSAYNVTVCAEMGSSNTMIARNALYQLSKQTSFEDTVLVVGWSEPTRFEFHFDQTHPMFSEVKKVEKTHDHKVTNFLCDGDTKYSAWLKSTGGYGHWTFENKHIDQLMEMYFGHCHSNVNQYIDSMHSVLLLQNFCKANSIPLMNFKAWDHELLTATYPETEYLHDLVDRGTWWEYNGADINDENIIQGLREFCRDLGDDIPEGMHPHNKYQRMFAEQAVTAFLKGL